jgi:hypothetical protein
VHAKSPLAVREVIRTERPGGSAFVQLFPISPEAAAAAYAHLRAVFSVMTATLLKDLTPRELDVLREIWNLAIVALLSQLTFASDTPNRREFHSRNALSRPAIWVS